MYFVCPTCSAALRVDPDRLPAGPSRYRCKKCSQVSVVREHLHASVPTEAGSPQPDPGQAIGTVYHHASGADADMPSAAYEIRCAVKGLDGVVRTHTFQGAQVTIGRSGADLLVDDPLASRLHAELERVRDRVVVKDLGSTNGTFVNEKQVAVHVLAEKDVIRVGNTALRVAVRAKPLPV